MSAMLQNNLPNSVNVEVCHYESMIMYNYLGGTIHQCGKCHRSFTTPSALRHHMKGHGSETPFLCEVCGFATIHFASINVHKKQHNGTYVVLCPGILS